MTTPADNEPPPAPPWMLVLGLAGFVFAVGAVGLEVVSGTYANSPVPGWAEYAPLAWPRPLRVAWWLGAAVAATTFCWSLGRVGRRPNHAATVLAVAPFVVFAFGVGTGADWATWH